VTLEDGLRNVHIMEAARTGSLQRLLYGKASRY
jgi:hypothetical protein